MRLHNSILLGFCAFRLGFAQYYDPCGGADICDTQFGCHCPQCQDTLECMICGLPPSLPLECLAFNETFDTMTLRSPVGTSDDATWSELTVVTHGPDNPIVPSSSKNMARSTTGTFVLNYIDGFVPYVGENVGGLVSFDFACADPCTKTTSKAAVSCTLTVTAACEAYNETYASGTDPDVTYEYNNTFSYVAPTKGIRKAPMTSATWSPEAGNDPGLDYESSFCHNYTFVASMPNGKIPFLYLDDMVGYYWIATG